MKTKVYILEGYYDYEGSDVIGVFTTRKQAENAERRNKKYLQSKRYDKVSITVLNLNQAYIDRWILGGNEAVRSL